MINKLTSFPNRSINHSERMAAAKRRDHPFALRYTCRLGAGNGKENDEWN